MLHRLRRFRSTHRELTLLACSAPFLLAGCGGRTAIALLEGEPAGGSSALADPPSSSLPAGGAGVGGASGDTSGGTSDRAGAATVPPDPEPRDAGVPIVDPPPCEEVTESLDALRPAVTLLVDQSRSMATHYPAQGSPDTRWSLVGTALFDPTNGVVKTYQGSVRFGIAFFTAHNGFAGGVCPILSEVPAATNNYEPLRTLYQGLAPDGNTPTGEAITQVVSEIQAARTASQQSIVLVTDGNPNTCANPMSHDGEGQTVAVAAALNAYSVGIDLYVLGISNDIAGTNLQQLANAGKGKKIDLVWGVDADAEQPYLAGSSASGLTAQFADIIGKIPFCEVRLQRDVASSELSTAHVMLDGQSIALSTSDGYTLKDPRHLAILGSACAAIKAGAKQLSVRISCDRRQR